MINQPHQGVLFSRSRLGQPPVAPLVGSIQPPSARSRRLPGQSRSGAPRASGSPRASSLFQDVTHLGRGAAAPSRSKDAFQGTKMAFQFASSSRTAPQALNDEARPSAGLRRFNGC